MSVIILQNQVIGPFKTIETLSDRLRADDVDYPFSVIGQYEISEDDSLAPPPPVAPEPVPESVTALQGLLVLDQFGMAAAYEAWANAPERTFAQRAFINKAQTWKRDDPTLTQAAADMGLTPEQLDTMFREAAKL